MNAQFQRLFWKEVRAQRGLWLILSGTLLSVLLLLVAMFGGGDHDMSFVLASNAILIPFCFIAASSGLLFAAEEEHGTAIWLRLLPVSTGTLFWSKFCVTFLGTVAMVSICLAATGVAVVACGWRVELKRLDLSDVLFSGGGLFLVSVFFSLQCRSVFLVLGMSGAALLGLIFWLKGRSEENVWIDLVALTVLAGLILVRIHGWHRGRSRQRLRLHVNIQGELRRRIWLPWLGKAASSSTQFRRLCAVLTWRECRTAIPFFLVMTVCGIGGVFDRILLFIAILESGLRSSRQDQVNHRGLFWSHRGVSPLVILGIRNAVWLSGLIVFALTLLIVDMPGVGLDGDYGLFALMESIRAPVLQLSEFPAPPRVSDRLLQANVTVAWITGGFCLTQLAGCWCRKPLIALFCGLCALFAYTIHLAHCVINDIPLVLAVWPIILFAIAAIAFTRHTWMDHVMTRRVVTLRATAVLVVVMLQVPIEMGWRLIQVDAAPVSFPVPEQLGYTEIHQNSEFGTHWESFSIAIEFADTDTDADEERRRRAETALAAICAQDLESASTDLRLPPKLRHPWARPLASSAATVLIRQSEIDLQADDPAQALQRLMDAASLLRFLMREASSWDQWKAAAGAEQRVLQHMHVLVADERFNAEQLTAAADWCCKVVDNPVTTNTLPQNRFAVYFQLLMQRGYLWQLVEKRRLPAESYLPLRLNYAERRRLLQLIRWAGYNFEWHATRESQAQIRQQLSRWAATTTVIQTTDLTDDPIFQDPSLGEFDVGQRESERNANAERATLAILNLQIYFRHNGAFPSSLAALKSGHLLIADSEEQRQDLSSVMWQRLEDVRTHLPLAWWPQGLDQEFQTGGNWRKRFRLGHGQPLILSRSAHGMISANRPIHDIGSMKCVPGRIVYLDGVVEPVMVPTPE